MRFWYQDLVDRFEHFNDNAWARSRDSTNIFSRPPTMPVGVIIPFRSSMPPSIMPRPPHPQQEEFIITRWATNPIILIFYNKRED